MRRAISIICAIALCGCEREHGEKTVELPVPKVTVHVIDPGAEPRAPLRYHGVHGPVVLQATYRITSEKGATRTITRTIESTREVAADGVYHEHLRDLGEDGIVVDSWFDARGIQRRSVVVRGHDPRATSGTPETDEIFPEEAVGVGAKWHEDIAVGAATASVDVDLVARDGDRARERMTYHAETTSSKGSPTHHDGTFTLDLDLGGVDPSGHQEDTYVIDGATGKVSKGTMTMDMVLR